MPRRTHPTRPARSTRSSGTGRRHAPPVEVLDLGLAWTAREIADVERARREEADERAVEAEAVAARSSSARPRPPRPPVDGARWSA